MSIRSICCLGVFLCCASIMQAQEISQAKKLSVEECGLGPRSMQVGIRHIENKGVGYNTGYTTLETFLAPPPPLVCVMPFVDLRGHVFDDGKWAANGGIGLRKLKWDRVWGAYAYYDYRNTKRKNYNQVSFGLETLGNRWDMRLNGYIPFGKKKSSAYDLKFDQFERNHLFITRKFEYALAGANGEVGAYPFQSKNFDLYTAAGSYYLKGTLGSGIWGGEARLKGTYKSCLALEVNYSYDKTFKNIVQGQISFSIPFGPKSRVEKDRACSYARLHERMIAPVMKNEIIAIDHKRERNIAIDPATGEPYVFWFVNNLSHSAGTFESPFATLVDAQNMSQAGDIIYIFPGDLTSTGLSDGIVLKDNQKLFGTTIPHELNTAIGTIQIPSLSSGSYQDPLLPITLALVPLITSSANPSDVITVANNNEISGLYIQNIYGSAIKTPGSSITNLTITHNIIQGPDTSDAPGAYGISLDNALGTVLVDSNMIYQGNIGINIAATGIQNATYIISNNDAPATGLSGEDPPFGDFLVTTYTNSANISTVISGNAFNVSNIPITMTFDNATTQQACAVNINNNIINSDGGTSGELVSLSFTLRQEANVNVSIVNNNLNTPFERAIVVTQNDNSQMNLQIENNNISSWYTSLSLTLNDTSQLTGFATNNQFLFDANSGIVIAANDNSTIPSFSITNNTIQGVLQTYFTSSDSIRITSSDDASATINIADNFLHGGAGAVLVTNGTSNMTASVTNNDITCSALYGLSLTTNGSSTGTWNVDQNSIIAVGAGSAFATTSGSAIVKAENSSTTYLDFTNNLSSPTRLSISGVGSYQFTNNSGATNFKLTSYSGNIGVRTDTGPITD